MDVHRDSHAQPFANLAKAWGKFFKDVREGREAHAPTFKKKGKTRDCFYVANDKFSIDGMGVKLPLVGRVAMREALRFEGKRMAASVGRTADRWFIAFQVDVPDAQFHRKRTGHGVVGADLGIKAAVTLSTAESIQAPRPLKRALRRLQSNEGQEGEVLGMAGHGQDFTLPGARLPATPENRAERDACPQAP